MNAFVDMPEVPWSCEAEQGVIGALLIDNASIDKAGNLEPSDYYHGGHQEILRHILALIAGHKPAELISVLDSLRDAGKDEDVGGIVYLSEIVSNTAGTHSIYRHAEIVREKATLRRLMAAANEINELCVARNGESPADKVERAQSIVMEIAESAQSENTAPRMATDFAIQFLARLEERCESPHGSLAGVPSHITSIDEVLGGFEPGRLYVLAGRPAMGKSTLAQNIAEGVAINEGKPVLMCSQEMPGVELASNFAASLGRVRKDALRNACLTESDWANLSFALGKIHAAPLMFDEQGGLRLHNVITKARQAKRKMGGLSLLIVDYLQLMVSDNKSANKADQIGEISAALKQLGMHMKVPVLLLSQLNRECERRPNKRPQASDLRDSGAIEQDADVIMFVYRDEVYHKDSPDKGCAELIIEKNRMGESGKTIPLIFHGEFGRFEAMHGPMPSWNETADKKNPMSRGME